jgi:AcrR family transcriptional regulator
MATQSERRKNTRHAILDAAGKLFGKEGFDRTAVEDITSAANVAKGTFYQHFETKADVLLALVRRHEVETLAEVENALSAGVPPLVIGQGLVRGMAQGFEKDRKMAAQAIALAMAHPVKKDEPSTRMAFARVLAAAQERQEIRSDTDPYDLALMLVGAMLPLIVLWVHEGKRGELLPGIEKAWRVLLEGLGT